MKLKILLMVFALGGIFYAINQLKNQGISNAAFSTVGPNLNWCKTRVKSLVNEGESIAIEQQGMAWKVTRPGAKDLSPTLIEKWLGANCTLAIDENVLKYVLPGGQTELVVTFIDGTQTRFLRTEPATFVHQGDVFKSRQFEEAWHALNHAARY